ncbi:MAG: DUF1801 domain-containing protein [Ignavibacteria bacterium]|nr:DUF1801 domain-containing protein [Ignavibacteria bacterium]MBT8391004.1 DUF1801 domain-containing protein [Ignavibacteria bacterium]NNJ54015.1 DUF1801 domain-containing protein [Ignavibacteriaceae bacterium]NNL20839.1 DUF1801 domain-containing protein [Ignavibacteriaceae bacterium]
MRKNLEIEKLLQDFELVNPVLVIIMRSLRKMVRKIAPDSEEKIMYGGIIYSMPERMFCGLFLRKNHISVEFDLGYLLNDDDEYLEGKGKYRRHLKIHNKEEIIIKKVEKFIKESLLLKI